MQIRTSSGKTLTIAGADTPIQNSNRLVILLTDDKAVTQTAETLSKEAWIKRESKTQGGKTFVGYNAVVYAKGKQIMLEKGEDDGNSPTDQMAR